MKLMKTYIIFNVKKLLNAKYTAIKRKVLRIYEFRKDLPAIILNDEGSTLISTTAGDMRGSPSR